MNTGTDISALYREFTGALTEVLPESAGSPARARSEYDQKMIEVVWQTGRLCAISP
jgi:hypothetical protein